MSLSPLKETLLQGTLNIKLPVCIKHPGGGYGNPVQYSCLENPMDGGTRQATIHRVGELDMTEAT